MCRDGTTIRLITHLLEEADQIRPHLSFSASGRLAASGTPRNLKLTHDEGTVPLTLGDPEEASRLTRVTLIMDERQDQVRLSDPAARGNVRSSHSQEAKLEEVFVEAAGIRAA